MLTSLFPAFLTAFDRYNIGKKCEGVGVRLGGAIVDKYQYGQDNDVSDRRRFTRVVMLRSTSPRSNSRSLSNEFPRKQELQGIHERKADLSCTRRLTKTTYSETPSAIERPTDRPIDRLPHRWMDPSTDCQTGTHQPTHRSTDKTNQSWTHTREGCPNPRQMMRVIKNTTEVQTSRTPSFSVNQKKWLRRPPVAQPKRWKYALGLDQNDLY